MIDNVIIFGAGASYDAGIPLMAGFISTMWEFAIRGNFHNIKLSPQDTELFRQAMKIKEELDAYHGRAMFDDRNLEDVLSILSFNEMSRKRGSKNKLSVFTKAISRTIELTCSVKHNGEARIQNNGPSNYRFFWGNLIEVYRNKKQFPSIITFNYDLVLERSFFQLMNNTSYTINTIPFKNVSFKYYFDKFKDINFSIKSCRYMLEDSTDYSDKNGIYLEQEDSDQSVPIEIIKLHGSVNFPKNNNSPCSLLSPMEDSLIMPPIFSKMEYGKYLENAWAVALRRLREAKNIIIVGYSLPRTDIYLQYFLKTALGPNVNLNNIFVFDPILFENNDLSKGMIERYASCFSPQLKSRIIFYPEIRNNQTPGTFSHFLKMLQPNNGVLF